MSRHATDILNASWRRRRIVQNNDGADGAAQGSDTPEGFLAHRLQPVAGTQVDTICYNTNDGIMVRGHTSKVAEMYGHFVTPDSPVLFQDWKHNLDALHAAGTDPLELTIRFARRNNLELIWTVRMNDIHDTMRPEMLTCFKRDHPQYLLGRHEEANRYTPDDLRFWWSSLDFEHQQNRDYLFEIIQDVSNRYDIDGIELDYCRHPMYFQPHLEGRAAEQKQLDLLTVFQRRIVDMVRQVSLRRGKVILVAVRVPLTVKLCRYLGIDIEAWLAGRLVDIMFTGGGYEPLTMPVAEGVDLGHAHEVPVYPCISDSGFEGEHRTPSAWRAAAANAWDAGADGIYTFNLFPSDRVRVRKDGFAMTHDPPWRDVLCQIGDPTTLRHADKLYGLDKTITPPFLANASPAENRLPLAIENQLHVCFPVSDDLSSPQQRLNKLTLTLRVAGLDSPDAIAVQLNGHTPPYIQQQQAPTDGLWKLQYQPSPTMIVKGNNQLILTIPENAPGPVTLEDMSLHCYGDAN